LICSFYFFGCGQTAFVPPVNRFHKRVGPESARPFPRFKPKALIRDKVAMTHHFIPFQTPKAFWNAGSRECFRVARSLRWFGCAVHHAFTVSPGGITVQFHGVISFEFVWRVVRHGLRQMALSSGTSFNSAAGTGASEPPSPSNRDKSSGSTGATVTAAGRMKGPSAARFFISFVFMAPGFIDCVTFGRPERWSTGWKRRSAAVCFCPVPGA